MKRIALAVFLVISVTACDIFDDDDDPPANRNPVANAGADQTVGENVQVGLSAAASADPDGSIASYAWAQTAGPSVTLAGANGVLTTFTAPAVTVDTALTFQVTVTDNRGATSSDSVVVNVTDSNQVPTAAAGADQSVAEGAMVTLNGATSSDPDGTIAAFAWTQTVGPTVVLATADMAMATFTAPMVSADTVFTFQLMITDDGGATATDTVDVTVTNAAPATAVISGKATFDHVKHNTTTNALDYSLTTQDPIRGATVQALDAANAVLATATTNDTGDYSLSVPQNTQVRIRVRAETVAVGPPSWDIRLLDNTNSGAAYVLDGTLASSGTADSTRNLNAGSGWDAGTSSYASTRASAPFAIMESIYEAIQKTVAADATVVFPPVPVNWSPSNVQSDCPGGKPAGCISTSHYDTMAIYILGGANMDTDEFDGHIIVHEWGHYFEDKLSRSDSTGGPHGGTDVLDSRIAFGEGFGNALSGLITADSFYRDSSGVGQGFGFAIDLEANDVAGWFDEDTVQSLLFDIFDATADGATDTVALGWGPLYQTFVNDAYKNVAARTNIHSYLNQLKLDNPAMAADITALAATFNVNGSDAFGAGETRIPPGTVNAGDILPIYTDLAPNGTAVQVCSINEWGVQNKLSARRLMKLEIVTDAMYRIMMTTVSTGDPDGELFRTRSTVRRFDAIGATEDETVSLTAGTHVLEVFDACNITPGGAGCPADGNARSCFNVTVTQM